jgi:hypothetical protein
MWTELPGPWWFQSGQQIKTNIRSHLMHNLIIHQSVQYLRNKTDQVTVIYRTVVLLLVMTVFLQKTTADILALFEHEFNENEITQCKIAGCLILSYFCNSKHKDGGTALYISNNTP